ncbi:hypothetical protein HHI36_004371 [Cryptolaemus montrouzieri]|uniref:Mitochondrial assembly of ribosomal large subunit protein 1 n=1 Tax=Cryptolaemus montrouzieri TaxID=559131 RepID=A0ABD2NRF3_9CUCU
MMSFVRPVLSKLLEKTKCFCNIRNKALSIRSVSNVSTNKNEVNEKQQKTVQSRYQIFKDDSEVILDIYDEDRDTQYGYDLPEGESVESDLYSGLNLNRGITGVFDVEDLIDVLKKENSQDIFVAKIPDDMNYADYICIVSAKSTRHMQAIAQLVRRVYKMKRSKGDRIPKLEGSNSKDWQAIDLGNIAFHIFSKQAREHYDLESLWAIGHQLDAEYNKKDPLVEMLENNTFYLKDFQPAR